MKLRIGYILDFIVPNFIKPIIFPGNVKTLQKSTFLELSGKLDVSLFFEIHTEVDRYTVGAISGKAFVFP